MDKCWFVDWFNTKYYHILYKNRDDAEAEFFIENLMQHLSLKQKSKILDVACGKGRHSKFLNSKGFEVTGIDLSSKSIQIASEAENKNLTFFEHDMRFPFRINYFDIALNLFTSIGYFENDSDNFKSVKSIAKSIKPNGLFIIDFFNANYVLKNLISFFETEIDGIKFIIEKKIIDGFVIKSIKVIDNEKTYDFQEKVQLISLQHFQEYFESAKLNISWIAGDYHLNDFNIETSPRLIICGKK